MYQQSTCPTEPDSRLAVEQLSTSFTSICIHFIGDTTLPDMGPTKSQNNLEREIQFGVVIHKILQTKWVANILVHNVCEVLLGYSECMQKK